MKKIKYLLPMLLLFITINVKAIDKCTTEEMNRLNELAKNVQFKTDYEIIEVTKDSEDDVKGNFAQYKIQIINMNNDLKIAFRESDDDELIYVNPTEMEEYSFYGGRKIEFQIFSYTTNLCTDELLRTEKINLPAYNYFYAKNKEECKKYPEFKYCKEFLDDNNSKTYEEMNKEFKEYLNNEENVGSFLEHNYIYIIIGIVIIIIAVVLVFVLKKRKKKMDI